MIGIQYSVSYTHLDVYKRQVLYSAIAQELNAKYYTKFETSDIQNIIDRKYFTVDGVKKGIEDIEEYIDNYVRKIAATIKRDFDTTNICLLYTSYLKAATSGLEAYGRTTANIKRVQESLQSQLASQNKKLEIYKNSIAKTTEKLESNIEKREKLKQSLEQEKARCV